MATNNNGIVFFKIPSGNQTTAQINAKIAVIDQIIDELLTTAITQVTDGGIAEYEIDTGQSKQTVKYRSTAEIQTALMKYESLRQYLVNKCQPRMVRSMDSRNIQH